MHCDSAGQKQFRSIVPLYLRGALGAIVAAAADSRESFASLLQWLEVLNSSGVVPIRAVLAINKSDPKDALYPEVSGSVETKKAPFAVYFFVSALTGDGVKLLF
jgi:signal recognition particle receptor subunit beta